MKFLTSRIFFLCIGIVILITLFFSSCSNQILQFPHLVKQVLPLRGMNLGNALEAPVEGEWGVVIEDGFFQIIRQAGFELVRIPIRWSAHALKGFPYTIDPDFFQRIDHVIQQALNQELAVVINVHHYEELNWFPADHQERFLSIWKQIALRYATYPELLFFELLNEPTGNLTPSTWNSIQNKTIQEIRQIDPTRWLIVTPADWGSAFSLKYLSLPDDPYLIATFHLYEPFLFTHQGASWVPSYYHTVGVIYPGPPDTPLQLHPDTLEVPWIVRWFEDYHELPYPQNPSGPIPVRRALNTARDWSVKTGIPIWLGEFGAYEMADLESRARWTQTVRQESEDRQIPWTYWEFAAGFGAYCLNTHQWVQPLLDALIPSDKNEVDQLP